MRCVDAIPLQLPGSIIHGTQLAVKNCFQTYVMGTAIPAKAAYGIQQAQNETCNLEFKV